METVDQDRESDFATAVIGLRTLRGSVPATGLLRPSADGESHVTTPIDGHLRRQLLAITVTPLLSSFLLPRSRTIRSGPESVLVRWLKRWRLLAGTSFLGLALTLLALSQAGQAFLPPFNEGSLTIMANAPPGKSLEQSDALAEQLEAALLGQPEVVGTARRTGRSQLAEHTQEGNNTEIEVTLDMGGHNGPPWRCWSCLLLAREVSGAEQPGRPRARAPDGLIRYGVGRRPVRGGVDRVDPSRASRCRARLGGVLWLRGRPGRTPSCPHRAASLCPLSGTSGGCGRCASGLAASGSRSDPLGAF